MSRFDISEFQKQRPMVQLAPLVDIAFWALIFYMTIAVFSQMESELNINVPKATTASQPTASSGKMTINITRDGRFVVNQQEVNKAGLEAMLRRVSALFPHQQIIIRADENSYHKYVMEALDACMQAHISDISFSAVNEEKK